MLDLADLKAEKSRLKLELADLKAEKSQLKLELANLKEETSWLKAEKLRLAEGNTKKKKNLHFYIFSPLFKKEFMEFKNNLFLGQSPTEGEFELKLLYT